jgi:hypothetical protein
VALGGGEGDVILDADVSSAAACDAILDELASHERLRQH